MTHQTLLDTMLEVGQQNGAFPSAAAAIGVGEQVLAKAFIGEAPVSGGTTVDEHTKYDMASLSKILGPTMIALKAMEDGTLSLTETIGDFFPWTPQDKRSITVQQIMNHTAGFEPTFRLDKMLTDPSEALRCILDYPLLQAPGISPVYSCMGYITLGKMLEQRFGKPLKVLAKEWVFDPLGMDETGYCPTTGIFAATEVDADSGKPWVGVVHDENARFLGGNSGNAGVFMPLCDGIRFATMLAQMGGSYLKRETLLRAIHNDTPGKDWHRGLGFHMAGTPDSCFSTQVPPETFGHTGFTGTCLMVEPHSGLWVLTLTNRVYPTRENNGLAPLRRKLHADAYQLLMASGKK